MKPTLCQRVNDLFGKLCGGVEPWVPMLRRTHHKTVIWALELQERQQRQLRESHKNEIARLEKTIEAISEKAARINWDRCPIFGHYEFTLVLDSEMFAGYGGHDEALRLLAKVTGQRVECEIRSSRFVTAAREREHERFKRNISERYHESTTA